MKAIPVIIGFILITFLTGCTLPFHFNKRSLGIRVGNVPDSESTPVDADPEQNDQAIRSR